MPRKSQHAGAKRLEDILGLIQTAAQHCHEVEAKFGANPPPELETLIKFHRVLLLHYSLEAADKPEVLKEMRELMKPVMDWAALQEKCKQRELAEQKYRDQVEAEKAAKNNAGEGGALRPETLEHIERELSLL